MFNTKHGKIFLSHVHNKRYATLGLLAGGSFLHNINNKNTLLSLLSLVAFVIGSALIYASDRAKEKIVEISDPAKYKYPLNPKESVDPNSELRQDTLKVVNQSSGSRTSIIIRSKRGADKLEEFRKKCSKMDILKSFTEKSLPAVFQDLYFIFYDYSMELLPRLKRASIINQRKYTTSKALRSKDPFVNTEIGIIYKHGFTGSEKHSRKIAEDISISIDIDNNLQTNNLNHIILPKRSYFNIEEITSDNNLTHFGLGERAPDHIVIEEYFSGSSPLTYDHYLVYGEKYNNISSDFIKLLSNFKIVDKSNQVDKLIKAFEKSERTESDVDSGTVSPRQIIAKNFRFKNHESCDDLDLIIVNPNIFVKKAPRTIVEAPNSLNSIKDFIPAFILFPKQKDAMIQHLSETMLLSERQVVCLDFMSQI